MQLLRALANGSSGNCAHARLGGLDAGRPGDGRNEPKIGSFDRCRVPVRAFRPGCFGGLLSAMACVSACRTSHSITRFALEKHGQVVTREEIRQRLWKSNTFVDFDKSLGVAVLKVREALGDSAANPRFLETCPARLSIYRPSLSRGFFVPSAPALNANVSSHPSAQSSADSVVAQASAPDVAEAPTAPATAHRLVYRGGNIRGNRLGVHGGRIHSHAPKEEAGPPTTPSNQGTSLRGCAGLRN